jgi:IS5 family transposase
MKSITETIGGAQALLGISYELQNCFEEYLSDEYKTFLHMLRVIEEALPVVIRRYAGTGRKPYQYLPFIRSNWAMSYFKIGQVKTLIQRLKGEPNLRVLCGFDRVPGKATFSRYFSELAGMNLLAETLDTLVKKEHKDRVVLHVSRDSTAIEAREKAVKKRSEKKEKKRRGRPKKGEKRLPPPESTLEKQIKQSAGESRKELDTACSYGCKKNSQGNVYFWKGYKLHLDISDTGFPLNAVITGANVHDSQLAIPMEKMLEEKVHSCYSLMDAGYDAKVIDDFIRSRGRIPVIDPNKRKDKERPPLDPAKKARYNFRTEVERANGYLKDNLLPAKIYVKGISKISFVLMGAVICLAALRTLQHFIL